MIFVFLLYLIVKAFYWTVLLSTLAFVMVLWLIWQTLKAIGSMMLGSYTYPADVRTHPRNPRMFNSDRR